jgi:hypothetical protein
MRRSAHKQFAQSAQPRIITQISRPSEKIGSGVSSGPPQFALSSKKHRTGSAEVKA